MCLDVTVDLVVGAEKGWRVSSRRRDPCYSNSSGIAKPALVMTDSSCARRAFMR